MNFLFYFTIFAAINLNLFVIAIEHCAKETRHDNIKRRITIVNGHEKDVEIEFINTGFIAKERVPTVLSNVGKTKLAIRYQYYSFGWHELAKRTLSPGEWWRYDYENEVYRDTRALITNLEECVGAVADNPNSKPMKSFSTLSCSKLDQSCFSWFLGNISSSSSPTNRGMILQKWKTVATKALDQIPKVGELSSLILDLVWEIESEDVWKQVKNKVLETIREESNRINLDRAEGSLKKLRRQIESVANHTDKKINLRGAYMDALRQVSLVHTEFEVYERKPIGYFLLPHLSSMLIAEAAYCKLGLSNTTMFTESLEEDVNEIELKLRTIVNQGIEMIQNINKYVIESINDPELKQYSYFARLKNYLTREGLEKIEVLQKFLPDKPKPFYGLTLYSDSFGRDDVEIMWQSFCMDEPPLTPTHLSDGKWNKLTKLSLCKAVRAVAPRLGGLKLEFEDGSSYHLGHNGSQCSVVAHLGMDKFIERVEVCGGHVVDSMTIFLSDKTSYSMGVCNGAETAKKTFAEPDHYIASFFAVNGFQNLPQQISSISVSFLPIKYL